MNWPQIRKELKQHNPDQLIALIKGLYDLSPANKAFIRKLFAESPQDPAFLERCRRQIIQAIYPPRRIYPGDPNFREARKAVNAYKKATGDIQGTIDLLLTYVERGTALTSDFGDIDMPFYERLETALYNAVDLIKSSPTRIQIYGHFRPRFIKLQQEAGWMGWGYGDTITDVVSDLEFLVE
jgi:hypothetical protein